MSREEHSLRIGLAGTATLLATGLAWWSLGDAPRASSARTGGEHGAAATSLAPPRAGSHDRPDRQRGASVAVGRSAAIRLAENLRRGAEQPADHFVATPRGLVWSTAGDDAGPRAMHVRADDEGIHVSSPAGETRFRASSVACNGVARALRESVAPVRSSPNRLAYERDEADVTEWLVRGPDGLEHGFDLTRPCDGATRIDVSVSTNAEVERGRVVLVSKGSTRLAYRDLQAFDAQGRALEARFENSGAGFRIHVDTAHAEWPITVDPFVVVEIDRMEPVDQVDASAASHLAVEGNRVAVGVANEDVGSNADQGAVYVAAFDGTGFATPIRVVAADGAADDLFGAWVDLEGDLLAVGAPNATSRSVARSGAVYVFQFDGVGFQEIARLSDPGLLFGDERFGTSVGLSGGRVFVGAPGCDIDAVPPTDQGCVHVFAPDPGGYVHVQEIGNPVNQQFQDFGAALDVEGDTLVVGVPRGGPDPTLELGRADVFTYGGSNFVFRVSLLADDPQGLDQFGLSVAVEGDAVLVGSPGDDWADFGVDPDRGAAYLFLRDAGGVWNPASVARIAPLGLDDRSFFGVSVAMRGDVLAIGANWDEGSDIDEGMVHLFRRSGANVTPLPTVEALDGTFGDRFGSVVALDSTSLVVASPGNDVTSTNQGSVFLYSLGLGAGDVCAAHADCLTGYCVDGVCCDTACGWGDPMDCQACAGATTAAVGTCAPRASAEVCRPGAGVCDVPETCDGARIDCPADVFAAVGTCRSASGSCDVPEACDGTGPDCPADAVLPASTVCRIAAGVCDVEERCDGSGKVCPGDAPAPSGTTCRPAAGPCDLAELCDGANTACPNDVLSSAGSPCRAIAGPCDVAESCDGIAATCPADAFASAGEPCRPAVAACDAPEVCSGASTGCPVDLPQPPGTVCRAATDACDVAETCNGVALLCPIDGKQSDGFPCDDGLTCTSVSACLVGTCQPTVTLDCTDGNACTTDSCVEPTGCLHDAIPACLGDAGLDAGLDAGGTDASTSDSGTNTMAREGGCSCRVPSSHDSGSGSAWMAIALSAVAIRRRARGRVAPPTRA